jgi:hypothetical protein
LDSRTRLKRRRCPGASVDCRRDRHVCIWFSCARHSQRYDALDLKSVLATLRQLGDMGRGLATGDPQP